MRVLRTVLGPNTHFATPAAVAATAAVVAVTAAAAAAAAIVIVVAVIVDIIIIVHVIVVGSDAIEPKCMWMVFIVRFHYCFVYIFFEFFRPTALCSSLSRLLPINIHRRQPSAHHKKTPLFCFVRNIEYVPMNI